MHTEEIKELSENLVSGYLKGELNEAEKRALICWIKSDIGNKHFFDECCEIWITAKANSKNTGYNFQEGYLKFLQKIKPVEEFGFESGKIKIFQLISRYAAIFIVAATLSGLIFYNIGKHQVTESLQNNCELIVPMGSRAQFILPDGTSVTLNAGSRLNYGNRYGIHDRIVQLEGEGYFKVAKDLQKPFTVKTSHLNVIATGTAFNVKAYREDKTIETTLVEGSVKISEISNKNRNEVMILKPNQKLTFFKEGSKRIDDASRTKEKTKNSSKPLQVQPSIETQRLITENVNVEPVISWKENRWIFEKESLSQIAIELERKFDVQIIFESERLKTFRFTGIILAEPIEQVLEVISISAPINYKIKGKVVTISENKNIEELSKRLYNRK
jgi:ferric-dicitrate binding protein FerR (iron transport regulator)